jgi:hypothetical protein
MREDFEKFFEELRPIEPPAGLFEKIILAVKREQELQKTKRLLFSFLFLLIVSLITTPFSWTILLNQLKSSGIIYFISTAVSDFRIFLAFWQDFGLAILESLPITEIIIFSISLGICLFTLRLFLYRKKLLFQYLLNNLKFS